MGSGEVVNETINTVIAAMLKHLGFVEIARKCANDYESIKSTPNVKKNLQTEWNDKYYLYLEKQKIYVHGLVMKKEDIN